MRQACRLERVANALGLVASLLTGCTAEVSGTSPSRASMAGEGPGQAPPTTSPTTPETTKPGAPRAPLRRLTRFEYDNTVRDLLGVTNHPAQSLPGEELGNGFGNDADALGVSRLLIDGYRTVAHDIASAVDLETLLGCELETDARGCAGLFIDDFGPRAFRRPLETSERDALLHMFDEGERLSGTAQGGIRAVLELVLQSPQFMYRVEHGEAVDEARGLGRPTAYEMATRLSYLLWGSAPDAQLLAAAARDELRSPVQLKAQAERLLADERAKEVVRYFHSMLLGISGLDGLVRNSEFYPTFTPGMGALYRQETELFIDEVVWKDGGHLSTLFTAPYTFLNEKLAGVYGISDVKGNDFRKVMLPPDSARAGLLTQPSILSATTPGSRTDPVVRGKWVYTKLLCGTVPDPPPNVPPLPEPAPGLSVRDRLAQHRDVAACRGCHQLMDPIGFGFERFDGMGKRRESDNDLPIDSSGAISGADVAGSFDGVVELGQKLSVSKDAQRCFVGAWLTFAYGRAETEADAATRQQLETAFEQSGGSIPGLLLELTQTDAFAYRPLH